MYGLILVHTVENFGPTEIHGEYTYTSLLQASVADPNSSYQVGLLREDVENQQVFIYVNDQEYLLYDFEVEVNDVINVFSVGQPSPITITNIETVVIDGISREKIYFSDDWYQGYYIEGIGSDRGVLDYNTAGVADYSPMLTCYYENTSLIYDNPIDGVSCEVSTFVSEFDLLSSIQIFPNPASDNLIITVSHTTYDKKIVVDIIDVLGNRVFSGLLNGLEKYPVNISELAVGPYVVRLTLESGNSANQLFIKK